MGQVGIGHAEVEGPAAGVEGVRHQVDQGAPQPRRIPANQGELADLDRDALQTRRRAIPYLESRRGELYGGNAVSFLTSF